MRYEVVGTADERGEGLIVADRKVADVEFSALGDILRLSGNEPDVEALTDNLAAVVGPAVKGLAGIDRSGSG